MMQTGQLLSRAVFLTIAASSIAGCGGAGDMPALGTVEGSVTLDGQPVEKAVVSFLPEEGRTSTGITDSDGHYELYYTKDVKGAEVGTHTVWIVGQEQFRRFAVEPPGRPGQEKKKDPNQPPPLPEKYNTKTALTRDVWPGSNTLDFKLE